VNPNDIALAKAHEAKGRSAFGENDYKTALESFKRAHQLSPDRAHLGNIGMCYFKLGNWGKAHA